MNKKGLALLFVMVCVLLLELFGVVIEANSQEAQENDVTLVCFSTQQCPNCPAMKVLWDRAARSGIKTVVVDCNQQRAVADKWGASRVPMTFVVYKKPGSQELIHHTQIVGVTTQAKLDGFISDAKKAR